MGSATHGASTTAGEPTSLVRTFALNYGDDGSAGDPARIDKGNAGDPARINGVDASDPARIDGVDAGEGARAPLMVAIFSVYSTIFMATA